MKKEEIEASRERRRERVALQSFFGVFGPTGNSVRTDVLMPHLPRSSLNSFRIYENLSSPGPQANKDHID